METEIEMVLFFLQDIVKVKLLSVHVVTPLLLIIYRYVGISVLPIFQSVTCVIYLKQPVLRSRQTVSTHFTMGLCKLKEMFPALNPSQ